MKLRVSIVVLVILVACYLAAGTPAVGLLFKPAVLSAALALKPITYHWANRLDRTIPEAELLYPPENPRSSECPRFRGRSDAVGERGL